MDRYPEAQTTGSGFDLGGCRLFSLESKQDLPLKLIREQLLKTPVIKNGQEKIKKK